MCDPVKEELKAAEMQSPPTVWLDDFNREGLAIEVDFNLPAPRIGERSIG